MARKLILLAALPLALAACSSQDDGESADDFAARVGNGQAAGSTDGNSTTLADATPVEADPPAGVDVTQLEKLGDISGADLGPRDGGCSFQSGETEMMLAGAKSDPSAPGKAVVRLGGKLYLLSLASGGLSAVQSGATYVGEGVLVTVTPRAQTGAFRDAVLTAQSATGASNAVNGKWVCS
ncbi:hypothetical protein GRI89_08450 [Altererythrobacter salegens]|uniref:Lipoprotein n=1 Tax=Croceibacterium salegens TaxID=1737568 RepID=A0A6I4SWU1_9SPHN|nr:hypothetical protein [Croceibacterium salegens]MXO59570.1 hypothetical protein [Croceibacterium salegens]